MLERFGRYPPAWAMKWERDREREFEVAIQGVARSGADLQGAFSPKELAECSGFGGLRSYVARHVCERLVRQGVLVKLDSSKYGFAENTD